MQQSESVRYGKQMSIGPLMAAMLDHLLAKKPDHPEDQLIEYLETLQRDMAVAEKLQRQRMERDQAYEQQRTQRRKKYRHQVKEKARAVQKESLIGLTQRTHRHALAIEQSKQRKAKVEALSVIQNSGRNRMALCSVEKRRSSSAMIDHARLEVEAKRVNLLERQRVELAVGVSWSAIEGALNACNSSSSDDDEER